MEPRKLYLCAGCYSELRDNLILKPQETSSMEKQKCQMCGRKCYGRLYLASDKEES